MEKTRTNYVEDLHATAARSAQGARNISALQLKLAKTSNVIAKEFENV
jgi:hypothetical protein